MSRQFLSWWKIIQLTLYFLISMTLGVSFHVDVEGQDLELRSVRSLLKDSQIAPRDGSQIARNRPRRSGLLSENSRWPHAQVPFFLDPNFSAKEVSEILAGMAVISSQTCVQFISWPNWAHAPYSDFVYIRRGSKWSGGCWSHVGRQGGGGQYLNLEPRTEEDNGTCISPIGVAHELMHTLGFHHEHSRRDRDQFVKINYPNILKGRRDHFQVEEGVTDFGLPYDPQSIMHYDEYAFAIDQRVKTLVVKPGWENKNKTNPQMELRVGQRERLSPLDIERIRLMYPCS